MKDAFPSQPEEPKKENQESIHASVVQKALQLAKEREEKLKHPFRLSSYSDQANELFKTIKDSVELPKELVTEKQQEDDVMELAKQLASVSSAQDLEGQLRKKREDEEKAHATAQKIIQQHLQQK